ncbi:c-type cytochrome [Ramlibacter rhizophilus]|uniref:C-type cytochrome n=1 Tax=Ramlibacter rhizophilus TaxID=1781167 RepID=A0A4Z0BS45_9BURK|nr:c-type cytochrome [Ramlibacter rhizophilus]TFZ01088.1 c-type cytochrome [Ramlibacter rhizophilus]
MTKLLTSLFAVLVASATGFASAQTPAAPAPTQPAAAPTAPASASVEAKVAMCIGCHGIPGYQASFPEVHRVPLISGQNAKYIVAALNAYKSGDRKHPTMRSIAAGMSEQDIAAVASWYEKQGTGALEPAAPLPQPNARVAALLQKAACASCHGTTYSNPVDASYPKIAGQHKDYLYVALRSYKVDNNPVVGRNNAVMGAIARQFTNAELKELADYIGELEGEMQVQPQSRFR